MALWSSADTYGGSYTTGTLKYDVSEAIHRITPEDTPFFNMIGDTTATAVTHEWLSEVLVTRAKNAVAEGAAFGSYVKPIAQTRRSNRVQTLSKNLTVSRLLQRVKQYGVSDMFGSNLMKRMIEWKTDCEHALIRGSQADGSSGAAAYLAGAMWLLTVDDDGTAAPNQTAHGTGTSGAGNYGADATFTEVAFNDVMQGCWETGGKPADVLCGPRAKRRISTFTDSATKFFNSDDRKVINTISVYESDFATVQVHLSRDVRDGVDVANSGEKDDTSDVLFVTRDMFKKAWIDKPFVVKVPQTGDSQEAVILGDLTLEGGNSGAHATIVHTNSGYTV